MSTTFQPLACLDAFLSTRLAANTLTASLIQTPVSKYITYVLIVSFFAVLSYETLYWSGIYLGLWEYHAKDIFTEIPVHCAHVYVRITRVASPEELQAVTDYFQANSASYLHRTVWNRLLQSPIHKGTAPTAAGKRVPTFTYNFEFSPEDFEANDVPELGSTVGQLRQKILDTFVESSLSAAVESKSQLAPSKVVVFNHNYKLLDAAHDQQYLSKCNIETGDYINSFVITY